MLILDGHSSHFTLDVAQTAAEHQVVIFRPPPHTMADSQLLDTSCFGPLKTYWSQGVVTTCLLILVESSQSLSSPTSLLKHGQRGLSSITSLPVSEIPEFIHSILPNKILNQDSSVQEQFFIRNRSDFFKERFANGYDHLYRSQICCLVGAVSSQKPSYICEWVLGFTSHNCVCHRSFHCLQYR